jgi:hypothetical protein
MAALATIVPANEMGAKPISPGPRPDHPPGVGCQVTLMGAAKGTSQRGAHDPRAPTSTRRASSACRRAGPSAALWVPGSLHSCRMWSVINSTEAGAHRAA